MISSERNENTSKFNGYLMNSKFQRTKFWKGITHSVHTQIFWKTFLTPLHSHSQYPLLVYTNSFLRTELLIPRVKILDKVFKNGPSKICGRQLLKSLKWYGLNIFLSILKHIIDFITIFFGLFKAFQVGIVTWSKLSMWLKFAQI